LGFGADRKDGIDEIPKHIQEATPEQMLEWGRQAADMRLRDEFAKASMSICLKQIKEQYAMGGASIVFYTDEISDDMAAVAIASYRMADAMLAARKNEKGE